MGLLRIDAQLTATELDDVDAVASAFSHLLGTTDVVEVTGIAPITVRSCC